MAETVTAVTDVGGVSDGAWFALGSLLAVVASCVAAWVTLRVEDKRRKDERQRWADERQERAQEREDREQGRREEAGRRWDRERQVAYAQLLADAIAWRMSVTSLAKGEKVTLPTGMDRPMVQAELLMSDTAREVWRRCRRTMLRLSWEARDSTTKTPPPSEPEREALAVRINREMHAAEEEARVALRVELGLQAEGE